MDMKLPGPVRVVIAVIIAFVFTSVAYYTFGMSRPSQYYQASNPLVKDVASTADDDTEPPPSVPGKVDQEAIQTESAASVLPSRALPSVEAKFFTKNMMNKLNYDVWKCRQYIGFNVDDMRIRRDWPAHPTERKISESLLLVIDKMINFAAKLYGYLLPQQDGEYVLSLNMRDTMAAVGAELWLSNDTHPNNMSKIAVLEYSLQDRQDKIPHSTVAMSSPIRLKKNAVYYMEFHVKSFEGAASVEVMWQPPDTTKQQPIPNYHLAMAVELDGNQYSSDAKLADVLNGYLPSNELQSHGYQEYVTDNVPQITDLKILQTCEFKAEYVKKRRVKLYTGIYEVFESTVFPADPTYFKNHKKDDRGNGRISQQTADKVLALYRKAFAASSYSGEVNLRYLEETRNKERGSRFLLETVIKLDGQDKMIYTSEYVYLAKGTEELCHTSNLEWRKDADVYVIVSVKDLSPWIRHLIHNMEHIYNVTGDKLFELVIIDFGSTDLDIENELSHSILPRWHVIKLQGKFSRSLGLQTGIDYIKDENSIVMTIDMHLNLPVNFIDAIRKHTVPGMMSYTPMFFRLHAGYTEVNVNGFWETLTYGLIGMYKSDWIHTKGFNVRKYKHKWGGEDWDALDKVVSKGIEAFRLRPPGLVHYYHSKANMWGSHKNGNQAC